MVKRVLTIITITPPAAIIISVTRTAPRAIDEEEDEDKEDGERFAYFGDF
jgi:hypothetical protein